MAGHFGRGASPAAVPPCDECAWSARKCPCERTLPDWDKAAKSMPVTTASR